MSRPINARIPAQLLYLLATAAISVISMASAQGGGYGGGSQEALHSPPGPPFESATDLLPLPEFIPGAGSLYIDPENAPVGPWLAYGAEGDLVEVLFMIPVSAMQEFQDWDDLAVGLIAQLGVTVDHVDVTFNGGHPGMAEPHYHIRLAVVDPQTQQDALNP